MRVSCRKDVEFAYYQGEELITIDTAENLAELLKVDIRTIFFYSYPTYLKRSPNSMKRRVMVRMDDE